LEEQGVMDEDLNLVRRDSCGGAASVVWAISVEKRGAVGRYKLGYNVMKRTEYLVSL
jgi:hypothetical protein